MRKVGRREVCANVDGVLCSAVCKVGVRSSSCCDPAVRVAAIVSGVLGAHHSHTALREVRRPGPLGLKARKYGRDRLQARD